jgi:hypothetical protein
MGILQENVQIQKESKKVRNLSKQKVTLIVVLFIVSLCITGVCYYMAWKGQYWGLCGAFGLTLWSGVAKVIGKAITEA